MELSEAVVVWLLKSHVEQADLMKESCKPQNDQTLDLLILF